MKLEKLIATICDTSDLTDAEVREELAAAGVDVDAAKARTMAKTDALMAARAVRLAIAAVKANPPDADYPQPWADNGRYIDDAVGDTVANCDSHTSAAHIAAAVNAAPLLIAEVERLQAVVDAARVAVEALTVHSRPLMPADWVDVRRALGLEVGE